MGTTLPSRDRSGPSLQHAVLWALVVLVMTAACDSFDPGEEPLYVVEAYLTAGEPLPRIRLSRTSSLGESYDFGSVAVKAADVAVEKIGPDGVLIERYPYRASSTPGIYLPVSSEVVVQPLGRYRLDARIEGGPPDGLRAETIVPGAFDVLTVSADTVVFQGSEQFQLRITGSAYPGRDQSFFVFTTTALEPSVDALTPLAQTLYEDQGLTIEDLATRGSPVLNEANYDHGPDGSLVIRYPWLAVLFYGPTRITVNALDDNLYDFVRTGTVQQGGSTLAPGEIPNVLDHVEGGTGIFGSLARAETTLYIARPK